MSSTCWTPSTWGGWRSSVPPAVAGWRWRWPRAGPTGWPHWPCSAPPRPGTSPAPELRAFAEREEALLDSGDVAGATELNADTWLGPHADAATRDKVRAMQRHAFEVQLAASPETGPLPEEYELSAITAPSLLVSGAHDLPDFGSIAADLATRLPGARLIELDWAGHLPSLERPDVVNAILIDFLGPILIGSH